MSKSYQILTKYLPIVQWIKNYKLSYLKIDTIAGLSVGLTLIPQGLAYGSVAGLPPQYGLFAAFWGPFLYFFFGTSKDLTVGPTAILSLIVAHYSLQSGIQNDATYAVILSLTSGCIQLILGLFSLGFIANYMSPTVVSGFSTSAALLIAWGQMKTLFGLKNIRSEFFLSIYDVLANLKNANVSDVICGVTCVIILLSFKILLRYTNKIRLNNLSNLKRKLSSFSWILCICSNILVIIVTSFLAYILKKHNIGSLSLTGEIDKGLPRFKVPKFQIIQNFTITKTTEQIFQDIQAGIVIVALLGLVEAMAIGKAFARKSGYKIRSSQEFIAIGLSNFVGSFFQSFPTTGSFSRTAINNQCMSKSPFSGVITGVIVLVALQFLTPYFEYIPKSSLSAVIIIAVIFMTDFKYIFRTWKINRYDCFTWFITFIMSLGLGVEYGVLIGIGVSFLPIIFVASRPKFEVLFNIAEFKGSYLWFPFISKISSMIDEMETENKDSIFLNLSGVYSADSAIINTLIEIGHSFSFRKKILVIVINNLKIVDILREIRYEDGGIECFKTFEEAFEYYPSIAEKMPLL